MSQPLPERNPGCEDTFPIDFPNIVNLFSLFGLSAETLHPLMYRTGAILAGGAVMNMRYNLEHEENSNFTPIPLHPNSDLDFWIADPTPLDSHPRRVYYGLICDLWDAYLRTAADYESYCPESPSEYEETEDGDIPTFLTECGTRIRIRHYQRPGVTAHRRIQLIFYDTHNFPLPARRAPWHLVNHFDLTICQIMLYASVTNQLWIGHVSRLDDLENHILRRSHNPEDPPSQRTQARIDRYLSRYPTLHLADGTSGETGFTSG